MLASPDTGLDVGSRCGGRWAGLPIVDPVSLATSQVFPSFHCSVFLLPLAGVAAADIERKHEKSRPVFYFLSPSVLGSC